MKFYLFSAKKVFFWRNCKMRLWNIRRFLMKDGRGKNINGKRWNGFRIIGTSMRMTLQICLLITAVIGCMVLSIWPFIVGMIWKSVPATVVTSLIAIVFRQVMISRDASGQDTFLQIRFVASETFVAVLFIFKKKVYELY